jgi:hypothetical protein
MRKSLIAQSVAAVVAGLSMAGAAHAIVTIGTGSQPVGVTVPDAAALVVNNDGVGHINIVPYYTVQNGSDTYINIVNADKTNGKAVKVRFRSASNSDDVFDFTVLLSPADVFAFAVTSGTNGVPKVVVKDTTCTLPATIDDQSFVFARLNPSLDDAGKAREASEGYVEILTMADIPPTVPDGADTDTSPDANPLYTAIKHVDGVAPCTSATLRKLQSDPSDAAAANGMGLYAPTTGLFTNWTLINVAKSTSHTGTATAIEGQTADGAPGRGNIVFFPQLGTALEDVFAEDGVTALYETPDYYTSDPILAGGFNRAGDPVEPAVSLALFDLPDLSTPLAPGAEAFPGAAALQAAILSQALAVASVANEYTTDPSLEARTDWVFSSPTRRYWTAMAYGAGAEGADLQFFSTDTGEPAYYGRTNTTVVAGQICLTGLELGFGGAAILADREETLAQDDSDFVISPGTPAARRVLCGEVSVLTFNGLPSVLGAEVAVADLDTQGFTDGWARIGTPGLRVTPTDPTSALGLPVLGFSAVELVNSAVAEGTAGNFGQTFTHRVTRATGSLLP